MYTLQMIISKLEKTRILNKSLKRDDTIHTIRICKETAAEDHVLYLSPCRDGSATYLHTKAGSFLTYRSDLTEVLNQLLEIMDYYGSWEKDISDAIHSGCTLTELLDLVYPILPYPLIILDNHEWMIACSSAVKHDDARLSQDLSDMLRYRSSSPEKIAEFNKNFLQYFKRNGVYKIPGKIFTDNGYALNLFHRKKLCGILIIEFFEDSADQWKLDLFKNVGNLIQNMLNDPGSGLSIGSEETVLHAFLEDPTVINENALYHELCISGWKSNDPKQTIYISPPRERSLSPNPAHALLMFNHLFTLKATEYQDGVVLLVNRRILSECSGEELILQRIAQLAYCAGISNTFSDLTDLPVMTKRAVIALRRGSQYSGAVNYFEDHFLTHLFSMFKKEDADILKHSLLKQLRMYDKRYGSHLYQTLFVWLKNERNITKTAAEMKLHRSTLIHRIERIVEMAQGELEQPESRLRILISYYIEQEYPDPFPLSVSD